MKDLQATVSHIAEIADQNPADASNTQLAVELQEAVVAADAALVRAQASKNVSANPPEQTQADIANVPWTTDSKKRQDWLTEHKNQAGPSREVVYDANQQNPSANPPGTSNLIQHKEDQQQAPKEPDPAAMRGREPNSHNNSEMPWLKSVAADMPYATLFLEVLTVVVLYLTWTTLSHTERQLAGTVLNELVPNLRLSAQKARKSYTALAERIREQSQFPARPSQEEMEPDTSPGDSDPVVASTQWESEATPAPVFSPVSEKPTTLVETYNRVRDADDLKQTDQFEQDYGPRRISCRNLDDIRSDSSAVLRFETSNYGNFLAVADDSETKGFPAFSVDYLSQRKAIEGVFIYPASVSGSLRVAEPAVLQPGGDGWTLKQPGVLKLNG